MSARARTHEDGRAPIEIEVDWDAVLELTRLDGAVPGDLIHLETIVRTERGEQGKRRWIEVPVAALPKLIEALRSHCPARTARAQAARSQVASSAAARAPKKSRGAKRERASLRALPRLDPPRSKDA